MKAQLAKLATTPIVFSPRSNSADYVASRNREVGQGHQVLWHQAGVRSCSNKKASGVTARAAAARCGAPRSDPLPRRAALQARIWRAAINHADAAVSHRVRSHRQRRRSLMGSPTRGAARRMFGGNNPRASPRPSRAGRSARRFRPARRAWRRLNEEILDQRCLRLPTPPCRRRNGRAIARGSGGARKYTKSPSRTAPASSGVSTRSLRTTSVSLAQDGVMPRRRYGLSATTG